MRSEKKLKTIGISEDNKDNKGKHVVHRAYDHKVLLGNAQKTSLHETSRSVHPAEA